jgi:(2Fe-2S) ferredoxin
VAAAMTRLRPGGVWECSHVGGDRFAANVVAMPHGLYYGRVEPARVEELVLAHERGDVLPDLLRGRSTTVPAAQAALAHVQRMLGDPGLDAVSPAGTLHLGGGRWQVRVRAGTRNLIVTVATGARPEAGLLTCHARNPAHPPVFEVLEVRQVTD